MKAPQLGCASLLLVLGAYLSLASSASAQGRPSGGRNPGTSIGIGRLPDPSGLPETMAPGAFITGRVTLDDGTELTDPAAVQTVCRGERHTRVYTDRHGGFSFQLGDTGSSSAGDLTDASNVMMTRGTSQQDRRNWRDCQLQAALAGFSSEVIELSSRMNTLQSADVGRIVLHRLEHVEGASISLTSALAPSGAKSALEKGREAERKNKWDQAAQSLEKAVRIYPKYAVAWFELGRVQMIRKDLAAAKLSFQQALAADAKYVLPYQGLAEMAFAARQWPDVVQTTDRMLALNPVSFPVAYFFNAVGNFYLTNLDAAEKSARQGIKVDSQHEIAKLHYVLGMILLQKHDYQQASDYFNQYIQMTTEPKAVEAARKQLAEIAKLSPAGNGDAASPKK